MSKFKNFVLILLLAFLMGLLHRFAQLHFEATQDVDISIGISYIVLFASALILPLPSATAVIFIEVIGSNYTDLLNGYVISTLIINYIMLLVFEWWINYVRKAHFTVRFLPALMLSCAVSSYIFFAIDTIVFGLSVSAVFLGYRAIEGLICVLMSMPILYLISSQNIGVRKYSPRYRLK